MSDLREAFEALEKLYVAGERKDRADLYNTVKAALSANGGEAPVGWMWEAYGQRNFTAGCHHKEVLESDGVVMTPLYTHPAPPSVAVPEKELKAQTLEWFADWLKRQSFAHNKRWTSAAKEALRCATRLRTAGDKGKE